MKASIASSKKYKQILSIPTLNNGCPGTAKAYFKDWSAGNAEGQEEKHSSWKAKPTETNARGRDKDSVLTSECLATLSSVRKAALTRGRTPGVLKSTQHNKRGDRDFTGELPG